MEHPDQPTRIHDFYAGRGPQAKYLGTARLTTDVGRISDALLAPHGLWREGSDMRKFTDDVWAKRVSLLLESTSHLGEENAYYEWPHPYKNSLDTDYSWWFESGGLYLYNLGALVEIRYPNGGIKSKLRFPDFTPNTNR
jgi:hypothetical protein